MERAHREMLKKASRRVDRSLSLPDRMDHEVVVVTENEQPRPLAEVFLEQLAVLPSEIYVPAGQQLNNSSPFFVACFKHLGHPLRAQCDLSKKAVLQS